MNTEAIGYVNYEKIPLSEYRAIDWKNASFDKFMGVFWPRGSERGNLHSEEARLIIDACIENNILAVTEIGVMYGTSTRLFGALTARTGGTVRSIDAGMMPSVEQNNILLGFDHVTLIREWSPWFSKMYSGPIDFLLVDGDHSLISALVDYHYFNHFLIRGGIVAFHDMNMPEVSRAVDLIKERDRLTDIGFAGRLLLCRKETDPGELYFQTIARKP